MLKKTKRADKKRNKAKIAKALLKDPTLTERELAKVAWVSLWTAHNHKEELEQSWTEDPRIQAICDKDMEIIQDWLNFVHGKIKWWKASMRDVISAIDSWTKRNILFRPKKDWENKWPITIVWWL